MILMLNIFLLYYILLSTVCPYHRLKEFLLRMMPLNNSNNNFPVKNLAPIHPQILILQQDRGRVYCLQGTTVHTILKMD